MRLHKAWLFSYYASKSSNIEIRKDDVKQKVYRYALITIEDIIVVSRFTDTEYFNLFKKHTIKTYLVNELQCLYKKERQIYNQPPAPSHLGALVARDLHQDQTVHERWMNKLAAHIVTPLCKKGCYALLRF